MARTAKSAFFQRLKHGKDEVTNRIQDNVAKAFSGVGEALAEVPTFDETDEAIAASPVFTSIANGLAPLSGGGTTKYLRADATWQVPPAPAGKTLLRTSYLTSGTSLAAFAGTTLARARIWAGGGGGGGAQQSGVGANRSVAGAGAVGGYAEFVTTTIPASWSYAIGGTGAGGAGSSGATGTAGGNSTFSDGVTTVTANGGPGGPGDTATTAHSVLGAAPPAVSTNGTLNGSGAPGGAAIMAAAAAYLSGEGGSSSLGAGGRARTTEGAGNAAIGFASGGGGAAADTTADRDGGASSAGVIVLEEFG